jgi:hypothetical protein
MNLNPKNKQELIQSLQKQKDFRVELIFNGSPSEFATKVKDLKTGGYTFIAIKN